MRSLAARASFRRPCPMAAQPPTTAAEERHMTESSDKTDRWAADVRKYAPGAEIKAIAGIVHHLGIALARRDSSLVSFTDKREIARVRDSFLKKKLALQVSDAELDQAIAEVGEKMKADGTKNRVTVYYLLAERFDKLAIFQ